MNWLADVSARIGLIRGVLLNKQNVLGAIILRSLGQPASPGNRMTGLAREIMIKLICHTPKLHE